MIGLSEEDDTMAILPSNEEDVATLANKVKYAADFSRQTCTDSPGKQNNVLEQALNC